MTTQWSAANWKEHMVDGARLKTAWRSAEVTSDGLSGNQGVLGIPKKPPPSKANRAESCNEEVPAGSGQRRSNEQAEEDSGSKQVVNRAELCRETAFDEAGSNFPGARQGIQAPYEKDRNLPTQVYSKMSDDNDSYKLSDREDKEFSVTLPDPAVAPLEDVSYAAYDTPEENNKKAEASQREISKQQQQQQPVAEGSTAVRPMLDDDSEEMYAWYDEMEAECEFYGWEGSDDEEDCFLQFDYSSEEEGSSHGEPSDANVASEFSAEERPVANYRSGFVERKQIEKKISPLNLELADEDWQ
ncbi:hypothetical protein EJB05_26690, partial [Eragrostis curvula]